MNANIQRDEYRRAMQLLGHARRGDEVAREQLATFLAEHFHWMIARFDVRDPAVDAEDLRQAFWMAIWIAIPQCDGRGSDLFHAAIRGRWAASSYIKMVNNRRHGTHGDVTVQSVDLTDEDIIEDQDEFVQPERHLMRECDKQIAKDQLRHMVANAQLVGRDYDTLEWMMRNVDDLGKLGTNKRMAQEMGFTEQRASALTSRVSKKLIAAQ